MKPRWTSRPGSRNRRPPNNRPTPMPSRQSLTNSTVSGKASRELSSLISSLLERSLVSRRNKTRKARKISPRRTRRMTKAKRGSGRRNRTRTTKKKSKKKIGQRTSKMMKIPGSLPMILLR